MSGITLENIQQAVSQMKAHKIEPQPLIVACTAERAIEFAAALGVAWEPNRRGQQRIGQYLVVT